MSRRQLLRKPEDRAERNLRLVPPPKPRRRPKRRFRIPVRILKARYPPELLAYEEEVVYRAVVEQGGKASAEQLMTAYPGRFRSEGLCWTLRRLAAEGRLLDGQSHQRRPLWEPYYKKPWFARTGWRHSRWHQYWTREHGGKHR